MPYIVDSLVLRHERALHYDHETDVDTDRYALSIVHAAHVAEVREEVGEVEADEAEDGGAGAETVRVWSDAHRQHDAAEARQPIQDDCAHGSNACLDAGAHIHLPEHVAGYVLQVAVKQRRRNEAPQLPLRPDLLDVGPAPIDASVVWLQERGIVEAVDAARDNVD